MQWSDLPLKPSPRTLKQFAALWMIFFGGLAIFQWFVRSNETAAIALTILALTIGPLGLAIPAAIRPLFVTWLVVGFPVGWTISRLLILFLFFGVFFPVAIVFRLRGRDALRLRRPASCDTYWLPKPMRRDAASYFRQY